MARNSTVARSDVAKPDWYRRISQYQQPVLGKAVWQILNTFIPYLVLWGLMVGIIHRGYPYWIVLALSVVAAGFLVRIFIIFHDCCHGSFFASRLANTILGYLSGILTFTAYEDWRHTHAIHHSTAGDLDRRGTGDVWTMTVDEYRGAPWWKKAIYRVFRNPLFLFVLAPALSFLVLHRFAYGKARKRDRMSVWLTNLALLLLILVAWATIGLRTYVLIQLPILAVGTSVGVWLFYVQHQFEGVYWSRHQAWDPVLAALQGSSYYRLPKVLQWFTGNIGLHHIHHVRPRIPNYNLQQCYDEMPELQAVKSLTLGRSLGSLWLNLWDEDRQQLVSFRSLRAAP